MKKFFVLAVAMVFVLGFATFVANAQVPVAQQQEVPYVVQEGDTLWALEGAFTGQPAQWGRLLDLNPFLNSPGRVWQDNDRTIVIIRPGERLQGLTDLGIVPRMNPTDYLAKAVDNPTTLASPPASATKPVEKSGTPWWVWFFVAWGVLAGLVLVWAVIHAAMERDPIAAGPAVVPGGVTDQTVADRFRGADGSNVRVRNVVRGKISGAMQVHYGDGSRKLLRLKDEIGYRAMVSRRYFPWSEEYMLQGCGNELTMSGMRYIPGMGFQFVLDGDGVIENVTTTAQPQPAPTPATPAPAPAANTATAPAEPLAPATQVSTDMIYRPIVESADDKDEKGLSFRPASKGRPYLIESKGFDSLDISIKDGRTTIRFS